MELNDREGAEADLKSALALAPNDPNAVFNLGTLQMKQGRLEQAADSFQRALNFAPRDTQIRFNAALALDRLGMHDAAQDVLRRDRRAVRMWEKKGGPRVPPRIGLVFYLVIAVAAIGMAVFVAWRLHTPR